MRRISAAAASNRHSRRALDNRRLVRRGFLPRGLSNTCPQAGVLRRPVLRDGQVSDKPKLDRSLAERTRGTASGREREVTTSSRVAKYPGMEIAALPQTWKTDSMRLIPVACSPCRLASSRQPDTAARTSSTMVSAGPSASL